MGKTPDTQREVDRLGRYYSTLGDDELLQLFEQRHTLTEEACAALQGVLTARGLDAATSEAQAEAKAPDEAGAVEIPQPAQQQRRTPRPAAARPIPHLELPPPVSGRAFAEERDRLARTYGQWSDEELAALALDWATLTDAAKFALHDVIESRGLTPEDLAAAAAPTEERDDERDEETVALDPDSEASRRQLRAYFSQASVEDLQAALNEGNISDTARAVIADILQARLGVEAPEGLVAAATFANGADASWAAEALAAEGIDCAIGNESEEDDEAPATILVNSGDLEAARSILARLEEEQGD